jgi:hypothetical protein
MTDTVRKTPPYLKALAERRARAAGEVDRLQESAETVAKQLATAEATLSEVDAELQRIESRLNPLDIVPIRGRKGSHRLPRGTLQKTILEIVKAAGPVTTTEIADEIEARFQLEFVIEQLRIDWRHGSVGKQLRRYLKAGLVEQICGSKPNGVDDRWRLKSDAVLSSDHLKAQAAAQGVEVLEYDAFHE